MAPPDQALLAVRALKYRCALSGHAFRNCIEKFEDYLAFRTSKFSGCSSKSSPDFCFATLRSN